MAAEQKIIQDLDKAFAGLTVTLETLQKVLAQNKAAQQEQIQYIESLKKAIGDSKEWRAFADATAKVTDAQKALTQQQKDALDIAKKEEQLKQQQIRTSEAARKAQEAQTRATEKAKKQSQEAVSLYKQQTDRLRELTKQAKEAAIAYGINSKEAKALAREQQQLDKQIKAVDSSLGINNRNVGGYTKSIISATTSIFGIAGGLSIASAAFGKIKEEIVKNSKIQNILNQQYDLTRSQLSEMAKQVQIISNVYEKDYNEVIEASNALSKEFGISGTAALDLIQQGFEKGADNSGDFLNQLREYPAQLKTVGLNAEQSIAIMTQAVTEGVFSDKGVDAIKEAGIRLRELTPATRAALDAIGLSSKEIETSLRDGSKSMFDVIQDVSRQLNTLPPNSREVGAALADIFGGPGEDAGIRYISMLGDVEMSLDKLTDKTDPFVKSQRDLKQEWTELALTWQATSGIATEFNKMMLTIAKSLTSVVAGLNALTGEIKGDELNGWEKLMLRLSAFLPNMAGINARATILVNNAAADIEDTTGELTDTTDKQEESINKVVDVVKKQVAAETDLIKIQEYLLGIAKALPGTTEDEITARNKKIQVIEAEIKRLKDLGKIQAPEQLKAISEDDILSDAEKAREELDKINDQEIADWLDKEKQKTDITKQYADEREELQKEVNEKLGELFSEIGNTFFEVENEKYEKAIEANTAYYDGLLANEKLDEEQRSLIEAQKEQRENELRAKQRENEKKQFLFNQAFKVGEILMDTAVKIAAIKATAAVLAANPLTAAAAPFALAQIPLVKLSSALSLGTLLAQSVPQFDKGTESAPDKFIAGEKRPEIMIDKQGNATMVERPTLFVGKQFEGNQIISGADTAKMLANAGNITNAMLLKAGASEQQRDNDIQLLIDRMIAADKSGTNRIVSAINGTKQKDNTLDQLRRENLKKRLKS